MLRASLYSQCLPQVLEICESRVNKAQEPTRASRTSPMGESSLFCVSPRGLRPHADSGDDGAHYWRSRVRSWGSESMLGAQNQGHKALGQTPNAEGRVRSSVPTWQKPERIVRSRVSRVRLLEPRALPQAPLTGFANKCCPHALDSPLREGLSHRPRAEP